MQIETDDHFHGPPTKVDISEILRSSLERLVARAFQIDEILLRTPTRGRATVARARQLAMYLAHTSCGHTKTQVGRMFERDRTTVAHACEVIEDARESKEFDRAVELLEVNARLILVNAILPIVLDRRDGY